MRKKIITEVDELPIYAEYMHNDAYQVSKKYGKDAFYLVYYLGTSTMPFFYKTKSKLENFFKNSKFFFVIPIVLFKEELTAFFVS